MRVVVFGGLGDVGAGIARRFLRAGSSVVVVGRRPDGAERLIADLPTYREHLYVARTDLGDISEATKLAEALGPETLDAVIVSVHARAPEKPLLDWAPEHLSDLWKRSLIPHFNAARAFLPGMRPGSAFLGIGGGTADYVIPGIAAMSLMQSSQRMMYRALAHEVGRGDVVRVRELIVKSMVSGQSTRLRAKPDWLTDDEIGQRVFDIVTDPESFPGPILEMSVADRTAS